MDWLEPWSSVSELDERFKENWRRQLEIEVPPKHVLYGVPVKLLARGNGDDALFEILDGTGRVADVHLTWAQSEERLPLPGTDIYCSLQEWIEKVMIPEHQEWAV